MLRYTLSEYLTGVRRRKAELGITITEGDIEAYRNKGGHRAPAKRRLLQSIEARSTTAGKGGPKSYY